MSSNVSLCSGGISAPLTEDLKNIRWLLISRRNSRLGSAAMFSSHDGRKKRQVHFGGSLTEVLSVEADSYFVSYYGTTPHNFGQG